jgi:hypothetical protein
VFYRGDLLLGGGLIEAKWVKLKRFALVQNPEKSLKVPRSGTFKLEY